MFDPFLMGDNFQKFLKSLDGAVAAYEMVFKIMTLEKPKESFFYLVLFSNIIVYFE